MELYNDDCFNVFPKIADKSIDLFLLDLPYANKKFGNCTACKWDTPVDLQKMWIEIKRTMKPTAMVVFFVILNLVLRCLKVIQNGLLMI